MKSIRILSTLLIALIAVQIIEAATVTGQRRWLFGSAPTVENSAIDCVWSNDASLSFANNTTNVQTKYDLSIKRSRNSNNLVSNQPTYLYDYKTLQFSFTVDAPGTLTIVGQSMKDKDATAINNGTRTVTVTGYGSATGFTSESTREQSIAITGITSETTLTFASDGTIAWYSITWTPEGTEKQPLTVNATLSEYTMTVGETQGITVSYTNASNAAVTGPTATYVTNDPTIATVDSNGVITAVGGTRGGNGTATITVTTEGNAYYEGASTSFNVTVQKLPLTHEWTVTPGTTVSVGDVVTFVSTIQGGTNFAIRNGNDKISLNGSTSSTTASYTALQPGTATISMQAKANNGKTVDGYKVYEYDYTAHDVEITILKATPEIKTSTGAEISTLSGAALGLTTENSADITNLFKVYNGTIDITDQGTLAYTVNNLNFDGTNVSSTTDTENGQISVTWTPTGDAANLYNTTTGQVTGIKVAKAELRDLTMTVSPETITLTVGQTSSAITAQYTYNGSTVSGLTTTYTSNNTSIATVNGSGVVTAVGGGTTTITVAFAGDDTYKPVSKTVTVTVNKIPLSISASDMAVRQAETANINPTFSPSVSLTPKYTVANTKYISVNSSGKITALKVGTTTVTISYDGDNTYSSATKTINVTVTPNTEFEYIGDELEGGMTGTLQVDGTDALNYKFAATEGEDVYVFKFISGNTYQFQAYPLSLKDDDHNTEQSFDEFYKTRLTETNGGGDALTEYNGMVGGYGTENGGRYLTPITGTFLRVEPMMDGVVTITMRHNGAVDNSSYGEVKSGNEVVGYKDFRCGRRPLYVMDEKGVIMQRTTNYASVSDITTINGTYATISPTSKVNDRWNKITDAYAAWYAEPTEAKSTELKLGKNFDHDYSKNAWAFTRDVIYGDVSDFTNTVREDYPQRIFYSKNDSNVNYQGHSSLETTQFFAKYGYEVLAATQLKISFPVKAGKTYFVAANKSKINLNTIRFTKTQTTSATSVTLNENAYTTPDWIKNTADGTRLNVTLQRQFKPGYWHPLVLPFSVSESMLKAKFGENVSVVALDGNLKMLSSKNNYATRDQKENGDNSTPFSGMVIKQPAVRENSVTFTKHYYQMIYANCPVFICPDPSMSESKLNNITFENVTFERPTLAGTDEVVVPPYVVDHQIGDGDDYKYQMVAMYHATKAADNASREMYYISNSVSGSGAMATLYHAEAGKAPAMKGTRVWIEPAATPRYPIKSIRMETFDGRNLLDDASTSAIEDIVVDAPIEALVDDANVYDITGRIVATGSLNGLTPGIYIYQGRKHYIK